MKFQSLSEPETYFVIYCLPVNSLQYTTFHINTYSTDKITFDEIGYNNRHFIHCGILIYKNIYLHLDYLFVGVDGDT